MTGARLALVPLWAACAAALAQGDPRLSERCPPSFELTAAGVCELRSLYQFYASTQNQGMGGTHTGLPADYRDGFTPREIDLGRYLFFDPALSGAGSMSCASCHHPDKGFADGLPRSVGARGEELPRAAPSLWNVAFQRRLFWDARAESLERQAEGPLYSASEMANTPRRLLRALNAIPAYRRLFAEAYPGAPGIELAQVHRALAAFQASLISLNSRYDRYAHGHHAALTEAETEGLNVFRSFVARCAECHTPPLFSNRQVAVIGAPEPPGLALDPGAGAVFGASGMRGAFKVPSLRNVALTAPYMHSGRFASLREVVAFYNGGRGHAVPAGEALRLHWHIVSPGLSERELERLVDFLRALSDESLKPRIPGRVPSGLPPVNPGHESRSMEDAP